MIPFWCPRAETFLTDWFTSGKPRRLLYRHTHNKKKKTTERPNRSARRRRSLRLHQLFHQVSRKNIGKKQKYKRKTKQFYPHRFSSIFCFIFCFSLLLTSSFPPLPPPPPSIISKQFQQQQQKVYYMERTGVYFFSSWKKERKVEIHKHEEWLGVCGHSPPLPMWWNGRVDGNNSLKSTTH